MINKNHCNGIVIILSSPSGAGKSSIAEKLLELDKNITLSVSATTRKPRSKEKDKVHYFFHTENEFQKMIDNDELLEHAKIYGNLYGTPKFYVQEILKQGKDVLFDVNSEGAYAISDNIKEKVLSIFIMPPNIETLKSRITGRAEDDQETINERLSLAKEEMKHAANYDHVVINDDLEIATKEVWDLIANERSKN